MKMIVDVTQKHTGFLRMTSGFNTDTKCQFGMQRGNILSRRTPDSVDSASKQYIYFESYNTIQYNTCY